MPRNFDIGFDHALGRRLGLADVGNGHFQWFQRANSKLGFGKGRFEAVLEVLVLIAKLFHIHIVANLFIFIFGIVLLLGRRLLLGPGRGRRGFRSRAGTLCPRARRRGGCTSLHAPRAALRPPFLPLFLIVAGRRFIVATVTFELLGIAEKAIIVILRLCCGGLCGTTGISNAIIIISVATGTVLLLASTMILGLGRLGPGNRSKLCLLRPLEGERIARPSSLLIAPRLVEVGI
mmetsp:Transcript_10804/g.25515  ORF Transcript_10804/g.25515 Transcript_10804/m.25515 type:complete len:234 (-) Transcript_10804:168-869(-)